MLKINDIVRFMVKLIFLSEILCVVNACEPVPKQGGATSSTSKSSDNATTPYSQSSANPHSSVEPLIENVGINNQNQTVDATSIEEARRNSGEQPLHANPDNPPPEMIGNPLISDENDFSAVVERETITSDAERIAEFSSNYQIAQPVDLPDRLSSEAPNIVKYALETDHLPGTQIYTRFGSIFTARLQQRCSRYESSHQAQFAFLSHGGPDRDRLGLDPDGDGFACNWDPMPFRIVVRN